MAVVGMLKGGGRGGGFAENLKVAARALYPFFMSEQTLLKYWAQFLP